MNTQTIRLPIAYRVMMYDQSISGYGDVQFLANAIHRILSVGLDQLKMKGKRRQFSDARHIFFFLARKYNSKLSLNTLGSILSRDHATVLNSIKQARILSQSDIVFRDKLDSVEQLFLRLK